MTLYCANYIAEKSICEDIVQNIFLKLWNDRHELTIETSLKSYLLRAVKNSCFDEFRHTKIVRSHVASILSLPLDDSFDTDNYVLYSDLKDKLDDTLLLLPEKQREAFFMSRFENLKYREIADKLNVSERTVQVRIGKALELLRIHLKDFVLLSFFIFCM